MVSGSLSHAEGSNEQKKAAPLITYSERFHEQFPFYLAMGMTEAQYWDGDPALAVAFRKAEEIKNEKSNQTLWLQGMYIYEALCDAAPLFRSYAKRGTRAKPYASQPYSITKRAQREEKIAKEKKMYNKGKARMEALVDAMNKKFLAKESTKKEVKEDAD